MICVQASALIIFNNHFLDAVAIVSNSLANREEIIIVCVLEVKQAYAKRKICFFKKKEENSYKCKKKKIKRRGSNVFWEIMKTMQL